MVTICYFWTGLFGWLEVWNLAQIYYFELGSLGSLNKVQIKSLFKKCYICGGSSMISLMTSSHMTSYNSRNLGVSFQNPFPQNRNFFAKSAKLQVQGNENFFISVIMLKLKTFLHNLSAGFWLIQSILLILFQHCVF